MMVGNAPGVRIHFKSWITSQFPFVPSEKGYVTLKQLRSLSSVSVAWKCIASGRLLPASDLTFLHFLEAKESSGPLKAMNFACARVCVCICAE